MIREIVHIDQERCDGCGLCVPSCHEGAIQIIDGKARLVSEAACDGLGACLGHCPQDAIKIERREAEAFDEAATNPLPTAPERDQPTPSRPHTASAGAAPPHAGCPGSRMMRFERSAPAGSQESVLASGGAPSELTHWPVQINLLPPGAPVLQDADVLIAADCVPVAYPDFHSRLLKGRSVMIGCPKFDDLAGYVERLTAIVAHGNLRSIVVARMQVPCCLGIVQAAVEARNRASVDVPITEVVISTEGEVLQERLLDAVSVA